MRFSFIILWLATMPTLTLASPDAGPTNQSDAGLGHKDLPARTNQPQITAQPLTSDVFERLTPIFRSRFLQVQGKEVFSKIAGHAMQEIKRPS